MEYPLYSVISILCLSINALWDTSDYDIIDLFLMTEDGCFFTMKRATHKLALAMFVPCALTGSAETVSQVELFSASFTNEYYTPGTQLCDTGTYHGTWGTVPVNAAVADTDPRVGQYMSCATSDEGLLFTPSVKGDRRIAYSSVSICTAGYDDMSALSTPQGARAAFAVVQTNYMGWVCSQQCWTNLYPASGQQAPVPGEWQEVMVKFLRVDDMHGYVQYWLKQGGSYVPFKTADGAFWIDASNWFDKKMSGKIGIFGEGGLWWLSGMEPRRGLIVGIGTWYDLQFEESIYHQSEGSKWVNGNAPARITLDEQRSYAINVDEGEQSVTYEPSRTHSDGVAEVTEFEVEFGGVNNDDSIPADACARIRMVEVAEGAYRFACLANSQWKTNMNHAVSVDAQYTVEISLLYESKDKKFVSYRFKEGYGLEGGAYQELCSGKMLPEASGKTLQIDFDGYGIVHEIKGKDGPQ